MNQKSSLREVPNFVSRVLTANMRETCAIAVQDDTDLVYVLRIPIHRILSQGVIVGSRLPLHCHSGGRVLLSGLSPAQLDSYFSRARLEAFTPRTVVDPVRLRKLLKDVARQEYAWVSSEIEENISGLSVPIRQVDGKVIAALNVSINQPAIKEDATIRRLLPSLQAAADRIHASLVVGQPMRRAGGSQNLKGRGG